MIIHLFNKWSVHTMLCHQMSTTQQRLLQFVSKLPFHSWYGFYNLAFKQLKIVWGCVLLPSLLFCLFEFFQRWGKGREGGRKVMNIILCDGDGERRRLTTSLPSRWCPPRPVELCSISCDIYTIWRKEERDHKRKTRHMMKGSMM